MPHYPNSFLSDLFGTQTTTYRVGRRGKPSTKQVSTITYKGYKIFYDKSVDGWFIPQIDRESMFESKKEAKRFIDDEVKVMRHGNPNYRLETKDGTWVGTTTAISPSQAAKYADISDDSVKVYELKFNIRTGETKRVFKGNFSTGKKAHNPIKETVLVIKNPDDWFARCMEGVRKSGSGYDPGAVCASVRRKKQARYMYK